MTLQLIKPTANEDAIEMVEGLLERLRSGVAVAVAFIEVQRDREIATAYSEGDFFHLLNSGAATLSARLALDGIKT